MKNPLPILAAHCGFKVSMLNHLFPPGTSLDVLHGKFNTDTIDTRLHGELFEMTMFCWADHKDPHVRKQLWQCYFPDTRPHIYHYLCFVHNKDHMIVKQTRCTERMLEAILRQPKLKQYQLRMIGKFATRYIDELSSKKRRVPPDPRYMTLARALRDPKRLYAKGEIVPD